MSNFDPERDPVEQLADEFAERYRRGEFPSVTEYVESHPEHAEELHELLPAVAMMEQLKEKESSKLDSLERQAVISGLKQLGDFRIVREIGHGGMGVVYEAVQESLGRRVALKVLSPALLGSEKAVGRFRREAETVARLHHTSIVPVFGVGEERGLHYYVMQFIDGQPLNEVIDGLRERTGELTGQANETIGPRSDQDIEASVDTGGLSGNDTIDFRNAPSRPISDESLAGAIEALSTRLRTKDYWKTVAKIGNQVAEALQYAHSSGVCHRDIKPANLLIAEDGTVWLVDFGLARLAEENELTQTGDLLGTLRYMSPEQVVGEFDNRSDVYSLGLTLYELLTFRPAHDASIRSRILQQITEKSPKAPRLVNPRIPADLETIVLKATAHAPKDRYQTAGELAEDLQRFIDGFAIRARRASRVELLWRWSRRNPALATTSALTLFLLVAVTAVSTWGFLTTRQAYTDLDKAYGDLDSAQARAEGNLTDAMEAFEAIVDRLSARGVPQSLDLSSDDDTDAELPQAQTVAVTQADAELLQELLEFYTKFSKRNDQSAQVAASTARVQRRIGEISQRLGRFDGAVTAYSSAKSILEALKKAEPANTIHTLEIARVLNEIGVTESRRGQIWSAAQSHLAAMVEIKKLPETAAQTRDARFLQAQTYNWLGSMSMRAGMDQDTRGGGSPGGRGPDDKRWSDRDGRSRDSSPGSGGGDSRSGNGGRGGSGGQVGFGSREFAGGNSRRGGFRPGSDNSRGGPSWQGRNPADFRQRMGSFARDPHEARITAEALLLGLVEEAPDEPLYQLELAHHYRNGICAPSFFLKEESRIESLRKSVAILEKLVEQFPDKPVYVFELADTLAMSCRELDRDESPEDASARFKKSIDLAKTLHNQFPKVPEYEALLANSLRRLGRTLEKLGDRDGASKLLDESLTHLADISQEWPSLSVYQLSYVRALHESARVCWKQREMQQAEDRFATAIRVAQDKLPDQNSRANSARELMHLLHLDLSRLLRSEGKDEEADKILEKSRKFGYKGVRNGPGPGRPRFGERPLRPPFQQEPQQENRKPKPAPPRPASEPPPPRERPNGRNA
jgi:eukaryotic-like serine/threonine-protein kinase